MAKSLVLLSIALMVCFATGTDILVHTTEGTVNGTNLISKQYGRAFFGFMGIPFAEPPVGDLRFKAPKRKEPWDGILDATKEGPVCPQMNGQTPIGEEDCLHLSVFSPELPQGSRVILKPVMFYMYGGGFITGSNMRDNLGPDYYIEEDIVFVIPNYRLGALGLLSLQSKEVPGNAALKDQLLALKWVQRNIEKFGGDPNKVTIVGESVGGVSVDMHLLSPLSNGLFHQAISESGSALRPNYFSYPACNEGYLENFGLNMNEPQKAYDYLKKLSAYELIKPVPSPFSDTTLKILFCPTMDIKSSSEEIFLPSTPYDILRKGNFSKVPYLHGINNNEGMLYTQALNKIINKDVEEYLQTVLPVDLEIYSNSTQAKKVAKKIRNFYFTDKIRRYQPKCNYGNREITYSRNATRTKLLNYITYLTDRSFSKSTYCTIRLHKEFSDSPMYVYEFSFDGDMNLFKISLGGKGLPGACHADELPYLYSMSKVKGFTNNSPEQLTHLRMVKMWANFVKYGDPTPEKDPLLQYVRWKPIGSGSTVDLPYLSIDRNLSLRYNMRKQQLDFWKEIYNNYNKMTACWDKQTNWELALDNYK